MSQLTQFTCAKSVCTCTHNTSVSCFAVLLIQLNACRIYHMSIRQRKEKRDGELLFIWLRQNNPSVYQYEAPRPFRFLPLLLLLLLSRCKSTSSGRRSSCTFNIRCTIYWDFFSNISTELTHCICFFLRELRGGDNLSWREGCMTTSQGREGSK